MGPSALAVVCHPFRLQCIHHHSHLRLPNVYPSLFFLRPTQSYIQWYLHRFVSCFCSHFVYLVLLTKSGSHSIHLLATCFSHLEMRQVPGRSSLIMLHFIVLCRYCVFSDWKLVALSKSVGAIFPTALAHFVSLYHILVILAILQMLPLLLLLNCCNLMIKL